LRRKKRRKEKKGKEKEKERKISPELLAPQHSGCHNALEAYHSHTTHIHSDIQPAMRESEKRGQCIKPRLFFN